MPESVLNADSQTGTPDSEKGPVSELVEKYAALEAECAEHKDRYMRSLADFDNYRRRVQRDFETVRRAAVEALMSELVPALDNFERALATVRTGLNTEMKSEVRNHTSELRGGLNTETQGHEGVGERDAAVEKILDGIVLIRRQMTEALARHGLSEFSCLGEEFDPRRAEAVSFVECSERKPGVVVEEHCKGYSCDGKVIRPAKVVVVKERATE